jgi:hypothetical protein
VRAGDGGSDKNIENNPMQSRIGVVARADFVSRETSGLRNSEVFHVKHFGKVREGLLTYTELPEDDVQDVLNIHAPQKPPQRTRRHAQLFRSQLLALPDHLNAAP